MNAALIFDADNTIWDTDSVFRNAQFSLLRALARYGLLADPEDQLETLRAVDRALIERTGLHEYDFRLLSEALAHYFNSLLAGKAVTAVVPSLPEEGIHQELRPAADAAYADYTESLLAIPALYEDTEALFSHVERLRGQGHNVTALLLSEGDPARLERILNTHLIRDKGMFTDIIVGPKSLEAIRRARDAGLRHLPSGQGSDAPCIVIGDSLRREIKFGNQAGCITVYMPSPFRGHEQPSVPDEAPDYTITRLGELPDVLARLGLGL